ncbi:MAG: hypothetical protein HN377_14970 [Alphaproteobacteria bacterium]|jgi:hypothetical protein|nr:hypothetical protein [Alphaproteobacteria bacterium]
MTVRGVDVVDGLALLILRIGLIWFIFLWAIHKIIAPVQYQNLARYFDGVDISLLQVHGLGAVQILICVLALLGIFRHFSYGALALMHLFTVSRRWEGIFDPFSVNDDGFPVNRNQVIDLAVLGAFIALILLIHRDHFSLSAWFRSKGMTSRWV